MKVFLEVLRWQRVIPKILECGFLIGTLSGALCFANEPTGDDLLETLRNIDSVYRSGFTISGTEVIPRSEMRPVIPPIPMRWTLSMNDSKVAIIHEATELPNPEFVPESSHQHRSYAPSGHMVVGLFTKRSVIFNDMFSGQCRTDTVVLVAPDNQVEKKGTATVVQYFPPHTPDLSLPVKKALWPAGRGFSQYLDEVIKIETLSDGKLLVLAKGRESDFNLGKWRLVVDPQAVYMVRKAEFFSDQFGSNKPMIVTSNTGTRWLGKCCIPESSEWTHKVSSYKLHHKATLESASFEINAKLIEMAEKNMSPPYPRNTVLIDDRVKPAKMTRINELTEGAEAKLQAMLKDVDFLLDKPLSEYPDATPSKVAHTKPSNSEQPSLNEDKVSAGPPESQKRDIAAASQDNDVTELPVVAQYSKIVWGLALIAITVVVYGVYRWKTSTR